LQLSPLTHAVRWVRSAAGMILFFLFLVLLMGPAQRLIVFPLVWFVPGRRTRILGRWIRLQAWITRIIVSYGAGVRIKVTGATVRESSIVVMNHQSVLDVMIILSEVRGPAVLIPVRTRYRHGMPGISPYLRVAGYPFIGQKRSTIERDLAEMAAGADRLAAGEATIALFPEGHRSRDGKIAPFMTGGLKKLVARSHRPVYCFVGDGMWEVRTVAESMTSLSGTNVDVRVLGPFMPPKEDSEIPRFIESLRERMIAALNDMRAVRTPLPEEPLPGLEARVAD
jgi:1-acyl-sn-glycerol-3-phosphate acyltransferase